MIILKHVHYNIKGVHEFDQLRDHVRQTVSEAHGVKFKDILFPRGKDEFVVVLRCESEDDYLKWREICPPPPRAKDWYEVLLSKEEHFSKQE